jgi:hypothetical protein
MTIRRSKLTWLCPLAGGTAAALFLTVRLLPHSQALLFFTVAFIRDSLSSYAIALPLLLLTRRLGLKSVFAYIAVAAAGAFPIGWMLAHPIPFALDWTEEDFAHGPYWWVMSGYMLCSSVTGLLFGIIAVRPNNSFKPKPLRGSA